MFDLIPESAYLHIPFCRRRCYYCDFPISVIGDRAWGDNSTAIADYVTVLCREIERAPQFGKPLKTIFFGGGTPSLLSVSQLKRILKALERRLGISAAAEISIEMDPGTFEDRQIRGYRQLGVNRVSLGAQAFQDELLQGCGRSHCCEEITMAVDLIRQAGIANLSLDLISGLPRQTPAQWQASLAAAIDLAPIHLSCYDLVLEPTTAFGKQYEPGVTPLPSDEATAQMYRCASQFLTQAGYDHYEISNYARSGYQCRHNRTYWENRPYYGFGMGAASYLEGRRFARPRQRKEYADWVAGGCFQDSLIISANERLLETLMLGLRLAEGVSLGLLGEQFGTATITQIRDRLQPYVRKGWVQQEGDRLRLSDPEGFLFSNTVLAELFIEH